MSKYLKGFATHTMQKQRFSISKSRQKYSHVLKATLKFSRKVIQSPSFHLKNIQTFIKVLSAWLWLSLLLLYCWNVKTSQHQNLNEVRWFHSESTWPFIAASAHRPLPFKLSWLICKKRKEKKKKTTKNPQPTSEGLFSAATAYRRPKKSIRQIYQRIDHIARLWLPMMRSSVS